MKNKFIEKLIVTIVKPQWNEVDDIAEDLTFEKAFKVLDGYNLTANPITCGTELISISQWFDFTYKNIKGTIFRTESGDCELGETWELTLDGDRTDAVLAISLDGEDIEVEAVLP